MGGAFDDETAPNSSSQHDSNSIGPAPPAPATGITITRLHKLVTHELIYRHFSAYGRIAEAKLHTDPATGGSLGVCWVKYVDEKPTSGTGSSRDLALAKAGQDGHRVAKEAVARSHGAKLGDNAMSIRLDGDGSIAKAAVRHRLDEKAKAATGKGKASAAASDVGSPAVSNVATPRSYAGTPRPTPKLTPSSIAPAPAPAERRPPSPPVGFGVPRSSDAARWRPPPPSRAMWSDRPSDLPPERSQLRPPLRLRNRQSPHRRSPSPPSDDDRGARPFERRDELFDRRARGRDGPRTPSGGHAAGDMRELRLSAQRQLSENGCPHISFSMAPLSSGRHERDISADDLRAHFAAVKPADVFNDGSNWFVTFRSADGARRCHMVMNRQPFRGMALSLSVHESPMRGAPIAGPSTTPGKRSAARPRPPGGWSDAELLREARELIVQELRQAVERDIRTRIVDVKIREAIAKRPRRATDVAAQAKAEPADAMDVDPVSPAKKLPSFNKRRPAPSFHRAPSLTPTTTAEVISVRSSESPPPVELEPAPKSRPVKMVPRRRHQIDFSSSESEAEEETVEAKPEPVSEEAEMDVESSEPEIVKPAPKPKKKAGGRKGAKKGKAKAVVKPAAASSDEGEAEPAIARRGLASDEDEGTPSTLPTPVPDEIAVSGKLSKSVSPMLRPPTPDPFDPQLAVADDDEDLYYVRLALDRLRTGDAHDLHPDPADAPENAPEQSHMTGSARTEGYYKIPTASKSAYMPLRNKLVEPTTDKAATSAVVSRLARATTRRLVTGIEQAKKTIASDAEIGQFNQLRTRKKQLKFARSPIHDWVRLSLRGWADARRASTRSRRSRRAR